MCAIVSVYQAFQSPFPPIDDCEM